MEISLQYSLLSIQVKVRNCMCVEACFVKLGRICEDISNFCICIDVLRYSRMESSRYHLIK